ncbi:unnamed protein product [Orchesella dallaii]|uniref:Uncharacterized protein n=1 Tax=Orchesella dallaii TaxID=48710 RepID=A0ABP1S4S1_9HEXA
MKKITIFLLLFWCGGFGFSRKIKQKPTTILREKLNLDNELSMMFRSCSVHIVLNEILKKTRSGFKIDSYELTPFSFPVIISNYLYTLGTKIDIDYFMSCNDNTAPIVANQEFKFLVPPNPKIQCFAMVHITPKACKFASVFDYRIQEAKANDGSIIGDETASFSLRPEFKIFKSGLIIIHVEMHDSDLHHGGIDYSESPLFLMESLFEEQGYSAAAPTMFRFQIKFSDIMKSYVVNNTMAMVCWENYPTDKLNRPLRYISYGEEGGYAIMRVYPKLMISRVFQSFHLTSNISWQYFETLHSKCNGGVRLGKAHQLGNMYRKTGQIRGWRGDDILFHASVLHSLSINLTSDSEMGKRFFGYMTMTTTEPMTEVYFNTFNHAVHFITCAPTQTPGFLSIIGYISAFDIATWLMLMISGLGSGLLLHRVMWKKQEVLKSDWYPVSFVFNVLLGQATKYIRMEKWIGGCWILVGVVISFFYQGENINRLTAPILPKSMDTFDELLKSNLTIDSVHSSLALIQEIKMGPRNLERTHGSGGRADFYKLFEETMSEKVGDLMLFLQLYFVKHSNMTMGQVRKTFESRIEIPHTFFDFMKILEPNYYFGKVSKRTQNVFVDTRGNIQAMEGRLKLGGIDQETIVVSKSNYGFMYDSLEIRGYLGHRNLFGLSCIPCSIQAW